jgi:hypothetical protein
MDAVSLCRSRELGVIMKISTIICLLSVMILCFGCEGGSDSTERPASTNDVPKTNTWDGVPKTTEYKITDSHMFTGDETGVYISVYTDVPCSVTVLGSNDGDSDRITVFKIENYIQTTLGTYDSVAQSDWGNDWYVDFYSPTYTFTPTSNLIILGVHIDKADSYGTWPKDFVFTQ